MLNLDASQNGSKDRWCTHLEESVIHMSSRRALVNDDRYFQVLHAFFPMRVTQTSSAVCIAQFGVVPGNTKSSVRGRGPSLSACRNSAASVSGRELYVGTARNLAAMSSGKKPSTTPDS